MKEESEKAGLKLNIQRTKIVVSSPINLLQIEAEKMEAGTVFSWAPKSLQTVTAAMKLKDACSLEANTDCILKSRFITLLTKVHLVKAMVFLVVM